MPARSNNFFSRVWLSLLVSLTCWILLLKVPALFPVERMWQRCAHAIFHSTYQQSFGTGTREQPYVMLRISESRTAMPLFVVATGPDPEKIFGSNPMSPADYAVLLDKLKNVGVHQVMIQSPLVWEQADPLARNALELAISETKHCITSAPITRVAQSATMPPAFMRASIPLSEVRGNSLTLPQVNRLAIPDTVLGLENSWAGFTSIETESATDGKEFLLARWGDRVIFSSSLLAVCMREQIAPSELVVEVGRAIFARNQKYWWAIDEFGRCTVRSSPTPAPDLLAAQLIRPEPEELAKLEQHFPPVHLLEQGADSAPMQKQQQLLQTLYAAPKVLDRITWHRLPTMSELLILILLNLIAAVIMTTKRRKRILYLVVIAAWWFLTMRWGDTWLPLTPALLAFCIAWYHSKKTMMTSSLKSPNLEAPRETPVAPPAALAVTAKNAPRKTAKKAAKKKRK